MRRCYFLVLRTALLSLALVVHGSAWAQCTLPHALTNGQTADATQVMANFNALLTCINNAPAGSNNAIQYKSGTGTLGGVGPLTNGQLVIGSTGGSPQAQTLTPGAGIAITNSSGGITIAATSAAGSGLYNQVASITPTAAGTGLSNWLNQGSSTVADSAVGISINAPSSGTSPNISGRYVAVPTTPYTIKALIAATRNSSNFSGVGIGWYDGTNKLHVVSYTTNNGGAARIEVNKWNSPTSWSANDFVSQSNSFSQPIWLQIKDDGTNVSFAFSQDGSNFLQVHSVAKSSGFLGGSGYSNLIFYANPQGGVTIGTLMSWAQS